MRRTPNTTDARPASISHHSPSISLRTSKARRIGVDPKRGNVDFPSWMVDSLDREARRMGVTRQSLIKLWLADKLGQLAAAGKRRS
ncbi:MAG: type II toxin-antitoxin system BrnA family antitoxin [Steroidobacterales bacterium]